MGACSLIAHEYGHYFAALDAGAQVKHPIFAPVIFKMVGGTYIKEAPVEKEPSIAIEGGINGLISVGLAACIAVTFHLSFMLIPVLWIGLRELSSLTIGSDGRKYRLAKRKLRYS